MDVLCAAAPSLFPALLRGLADGVEKVREKCATLVSELVAKLPSLDAGVLKSLMPALVKAVGTHPVEEPSEEIRFLLVTLAHDAVKKSRSAMTDFIPDLVAVLTVSLADQFHDVKKACCSTIESLVAHDVPEEVISKHAVKLLRAVLPNCGHRHSQVRLASLAAAAALFPATPARAVSEVLAPGVRPMCADRTPAVRAALHAALATWITARGRHAADADSPSEGDAEMADAEMAEGPSSAGCALRHAPVLLPLLLTGVADETAANGVAALALVEEVGRANDEALGGAAGATNNVAAEMDAAAAAAALPAPFTGAPGAAACRLVVALLPLLVPLALGEVREWTAAQRNAGARLLGTVLAFAQSSAVSHLAVLVGACNSAVTDEDKDTAERIVGAARVLGAYVPAADWMPLTMDAVTAEKATPTQRAAALVVASAFLRAAAPGSGLAGEPMALLAASLAGEHVRACEHPAVRAQLLSAVTNAVNAGGAACAPHSRELFHVLLQLSAAEGCGGGRDGGAEEGGAEDGGSTATATLARLAAACGMSDVGELFGRHAGELLAALAAEQDAWEGECPGQKVLGALILGSPPEVLAGNMQGLVLLLACVMHRDREPTLRLALLRVLDAVLEDAERGAAFSPVAGVVVEKLVQESLVWKAGKTAAAVRYAAVVCLGTLLRNKLCPRNALLVAVHHGELIPSLIGTLEEDFYADTRAASCHAVRHLLLTAGDKLTDEHRRAVYPELLKRMDDSRNDIRIAAAGVIAAFFEAMPADYDETNVGYLLKGFVVHMDDPDAAVQEAVCAACEVAAGKKTSAVAEAMNLARSTHRHQRYIDKVTDAVQRAKAA